MTVLTLVRGLPGSGKSTLAKELCQGGAAVHIETDMYFVGDDGVYRFDPGQLRDAHQWCQNKTQHHLSQGHAVVVSNTFTQIWEMTPYKEMVSELTGVTLRVITCESRFGSIHNVLESTIKKMYERWERMSL